MQKQILTALAAAALALAILPGVALAGNPKQAVQDARVLRVISTESPTAAKFRAVQNLIYEMRASVQGLEGGRTKLPKLVDAALTELPHSFGALQSWAPPTAFGKSMRRYALWLTASQHNMLAKAQRTMVGIAKKPVQAQIETLKVVVLAFLADLNTTSTANDGQLKAAGQNVPKDELAAVSAFSLSG